MPSLAVTPLDASLLAAVRAADAVALVILLAFTWWGARKGALRQALSLAVLAAAFWAAGRFAGAVAPTAAKLFDLTPAERLAAAWGGVLFGVLLAGAILMRLLAGGLPARSRGGVDRLLGGLCGALKGAVLLTVVGYALLAFGLNTTGPALGRPTHAEDVAAVRPDLVGRVRGSLSAVCLEEWGGVLRRWIRVPAWVEQRVDAVDARLRAPSAEDAAAGRPRVR